MKKDIILNLEYAEANLSEDIQALAYIQYDLEISKANDFILKIPEIRNQIQILLKAMIYNKNEMQVRLCRSFRLVGGNHT